MKKIVTTAILCTALLLTGCSGAKENVTISGNTAVLERAGVSVSFPDSWTVTDMMDMYEEMYSYSGDKYDSVDDMIASMTEDGLSYYVYAASSNGTDDGVSIITISSQDMTPAEDEESIPLEEYARTVHDSTIFEFLANGYKTGDDSSFSQETYGGKTGYLSHFEIIMDNDLYDIMGYSEFMFQIDMDLYSIQVTYFSEEEKAEALSIFDNITAA